MKKFLIISGTLALISLYLLTLSTNSNSQLSQFFWTIVTLCVLLVLGLCGVIFRYILLIIKDKHNKVFGTQIARRLSVMFTAVTVVPTFCLMLISAQFLIHNIDSWFGNTTQEALERSLQLSKSALDSAVKNSVEHADKIRMQATIKSVQNHQKYDFSEVFNSTEARSFSHLAIWNVHQQKLLQEHNPQQFLQPELDNTMLAKLWTQQDVYHVESIDNVLYASGWLILKTHQGNDWALFFRQRVPENVARDAELIESARSKYAELLFAQKGLQTFFVVTLGLTALLAILLALASALYFARKFVEPILHLANGSRAVAQGDFSQRIAIQQKDELGKLTQLFNDMTEQLGIAKDADELHRQEQEAARHFLERVLESLNAGVMTLDASGCLKTFNRSSEIILDIELSSLIGQNWRDWAHLSPQHQVLTETIAHIVAEENENQRIELNYSGVDESKTLSCKAIRLPKENGSGQVLVFDNISALVLAQKEAAWGEVAKRLAHEIRNPLTPIQLSAERLAWKLQKKLDENDAQILVKSTDTIIKQVAALKEMVEAFRNYARAPSLKWTEINLNTLAEEVLLLYESNPCTFHSELSNIPLLLKADTTSMRQVLHNLFKNATEAAESAEQPHIWVKTWQENQRIYLSVRNNGKSFSKTMLQNAFEPYMTDKPTGTGLGLPVVKKIIEDHDGKISLHNVEEGGACVLIEFILENHLENHNNA